MICSCVHATKLFLTSLVVVLTALLTHLCLAAWADSSDDSYVSAGEDPQEIPMFEYPLQDTVASAGEEVQLNCIVVGTPIPQGNKSFPFCFSFFFIYISQGDNSQSHYIFMFSDKFQHTLIQRV